MSSPITKRILTAAAAALFVAGGVIAITSRLNAASADEKYSFGATQTGSFAYAWDLDNDGTYDVQNLASYLKGGVFLLDGLSLPPAVTGETGDIELGPGHGSWRYNSDTGRFSYVSFHADADGSSMYFRISGSFKNSTPGTPSMGRVKIETFMAPGEDMPTHVSNAKSSAFDLAVF